MTAGLLVLLPLLMLVLGVAAVRRRRRRGRTADGDTPGAWMDLDSMPTTPGAPAFAIRYQYLRARDFQAVRLAYRGADPGARQP